MIELGIPSLIIIALLLNIFVPEFLPLIGFIIMPPAFAAFMILAVAQSGKKRDGKTI